MNNELEVNWETKHKTFGRIVIKTLDLETGYVFTDNKKFSMFGIDSDFAKECYPTIPMLYNELLTKILEEKDQINNANLTKSKINNRINLHVSKKHLCNGEEKEYDIILYKLDDIRRVKKTRKQYGQYEIYDAYDAYQVLIDNVWLYIPLVEYNKLIELLGAHNE